MKSETYGEQGRWWQRQRLELSSCQLRNADIWWGYHQVRKREHSSANTFILFYQPTELWDNKFLFFVFFFCFFFFLSGPVACGILVPQPGIEPRPQQWEWQVLAIGPPGNSQISVVLSHPSLWYIIAAALESLTEWPLPRFDYFIKGCEMVIFE